jgi:uncharacterized protein YbbC (DUF1343 family)
MPDLASATHYPGTVIFEATNLSVGRGTPVAFQVIGAPWLDTGAVRAALGATAGAAVTDTVFVPDTPPDGKYDGVPLRGLVLRVTDRGGYDPAAVAVALLAAVHARQPDSLTVSPDHLARLIGTDRVWAAIEAGTPAAEIAASWTEALEAFREAAGRDLLYR